MKRWYLFGASFFLLISLWAAPAYQWPISDSQLFPALSATFGECRAGHFHAGIDLKTQMRDGFPVCAVGNGSIVKISASTYGYGKAIYLQLADGRMAVYGHLSQFNEVLEQRLKKRQLELQRYRTTLYFAPNEIPVQKGDFIGLTGSTGSGPSHLHFELRNTENQPENPLEHFAHMIQDHEAPTVRYLAIYPVEPGSLVNGLPQTQVFRLQPQGDVWCPEAPIFVNGKVGVGIYDFDTAEYTSNKYAIYHYQLFLDEELITQVKMDRISYNERQDTYFFYHGLVYEGEFLRFEKLFQMHENQLHIFSETPTNGIIDSQALGDSLHRLRLDLADWYGNRTIVTAELQAHDVPHMGYFHQKGNQLRLIAFSPIGIDHVCFGQSFDGHEWTLLDSVTVNENGFYCTDMGSATHYKAVATDVWGAVSEPFFWTKESHWQLETTTHFTADGWFFHFRNAVPFGQMPQLIAEINGERQFVSLYRQDALHFWGRLDLPSQNVDTLHILLRDDKQELYQQDIPCLSLFDNARIFFLSDNVGYFALPEQGVFHPEKLTYSVLDSTRSEWPLCSKVVQFGPEDILFQEKPSVFLQAFVDDLSKVALYRQNGKGEWKYVGSQQDGKFVGGSHWWMGTFALFRDTIKPRLGRPQRKGNQIEFYVKDDESGIDHDQTRIYRNGQLEIAEYDFEKDCMKLTIPYQENSQELQIEIFDRMGNSASLECRIN